MDDVTLKLKQTREIQAFRDIVSGLRDPDAVEAKDPVVSRLLAKLWLAGRLILQLRFMLRPIAAHDWIVVFDSGRICPKPGESTYDFVFRVGRTNRPQRIPELCGIAPSDRLVLVDVASSLDKHAEAYGTVSFLLALTGISQLPAFIVDLAHGVRQLKSPKSALIFVALRMIDRRHARTRRGLLMFTSVTWMAEVLRTGLGTARANLHLVEVLHGAGSSNTGPYFEWLHMQAKAQITYVNLIADLPRYRPLDTHMMEDAEGEIACNVRLWQGVDDGPLVPQDGCSERHRVVFIGGASLDADYATSVYAEKERRMIGAIRARCDGPILYCPHPQHDARQLRALLAPLEQYDIKVSKVTTLRSILGASVVAGGLSTSLLEAALLEIPTFAYEDLDRLFIRRTADLVTWSEDYDALADKLAAVVAEAESRPRSERLQRTAYWCAKRYGLEVKLEATDASTT